MVDDRHVISIVVATYGDRSWATLAARAVASAEHQTCQPTDIIHVHGSTLDQARNDGAAQAAGKYLVFLDGDDELDDHYVAEMMTVIEAHPKDALCLLQPATLGVYPDGHEDDEAVVIPRRGRSIVDGNHLVIGTAIRRDQFLRLGGFAPLPVLEDWHLFIRAILDGAEEVPVPRAIYRVHVRQGSRNHADAAAHRSVYQQVRREFLSQAEAMGR